MPSRIIKKSDRGIGDSVRNLTRITGIDKVVEGVSKVLDVPCGCGKRQEKLNDMFPYDKK